MRTYNVNATITVVADSAEDAINRVSNNVWHGQNEIVTVSYNGTPKEVK